MLRTGRFPKLVAAVALVGVGCVGQVDGPAGSGANGVGTGGSDNPGGKGGGGKGGSGGGTVTPPVKVPGEPGPAVFRRLSRVEYNNTVSDLLGDDGAPATLFPPDHDSAKSGFLAGGTVSDADASHLFDATEALASRAMGRLDKLAPCNPATAAASEQDACAAEFITTFGKRAFRRPLTDDEATKFKDYYKAQRTAGADFPNAMRLLVSAFLLSPQFLYRWEVTTDKIIRDGNLVRYNSYEIASRLSYLFLASMPDDKGFELADQGKLDTAEQIEAEARRLIKLPKAKRAIADFFTQWTGITDLRNSPKDPKVFKDFSRELADSMIAETATFAASNVVDGDGKLATLLTSNKTFLDARLATFYGVTGVTATTPTEATLNPAQRAGILTHASFLAQSANSDETNPPRRGKIIIDRVICAEMGTPPDNVPDPDPPAPNVSVRERFEKHSRMPCAAACHQVIDPLGFAFENYNLVGAWQDQDGGKAVNAAGKIELDGEEKSFKDAVGMVGHFAKSKQVADCLAEQFLRYMLRRKNEDGDKASLAAITEAFGGSQNNVRELMVAMTKTRAFTHRTPSTGEVLP